MTLSGTINKSLILFFAFVHLLLIWWLTFNGMNPLVLQLERNCWISFSANFSFQTTILSLFSAGLRFI
jgi:hypothetical protein